MPRYTEEQAREAVASSLCYSHALQKLGLRPAGGNHQLFRRYVDQIWCIPTDHFDPDRARGAKLRRVGPTPLEDVLVKGSRYRRGTLKRRLYETGLKDRSCELCGQGEEWMGRRMSLIIDHINGVPDDNRLENLRIVCPNCAATLPTHCGRKNRLKKRECPGCGDAFAPRYSKQRYCSRECGTRHKARIRKPRPEVRKVERPSFEQLQADIEAMSFLAIGRKYGVSGNAVRKWLQSYEYHAAVRPIESGQPGTRGEEAA